MNESKVAGSGRSLTSLIDAEPVSSYQTVIIALCAMIAMLDGFDTQAVAFVAPLLAVAFKASVGVFGSVFASGLLGGLLGALVFGLVADRFGRKATLIVTVGLFAVSSLLTIRAGSVLQLLVYRFVTGIGLGGAMPSIIAMTAEYAPRRLRATLVTAMFCGFPLGAVIGAIASTRLLPIYGWQAVFLTGGVLPLLLLPLVILALPESIRWLAARNRQDAISRVLTRMRRRGLWNGRTTVEDEPAPRSSHV